MKYELAIFDLDGTLLDTLEDLMISVNYAMSLNGFAPRSYQEIRTFVGKGMQNLIRQSVPQEAGLTDEKIAQVLQQFQAHYAVHKEDHTGPYEGIVQMLDALKEAGMHMAVVSNKADAAVKPLIAGAFPGMFETAVGEREGIRRKPAPDTVYAVLDALEVQKEKAVYIGDSEYDIQTAENAGMDAVIVTWGYRDRDVLEAAGAKVFAESPAQLQKILLGSGKPEH